MAAGVEPGSEGTVIFFPEGAYGPTNNCIGIADVMRRRGWRVVFIAEESFEGTFEEKGFEERLMRLGPAPEEEEDPGQFWKDFIRETAPVFRKPTIEQLEGFIAPTFEALIDGARYVDERLIEIIDEVRPDVIVEDNVVSLPGAPRQRRPLGPDRLLQPGRGEGPRACRRRSPATRSPTAVAGTQFRAEYARVIRPLYESFNEFCRERGAPPLPPLELMHDSPDLDLWLYPGGGRLRALRTARRDLAQPRIVRSRDRRALADPRGARGRRARGAAARLPQPRLARLRRRRADAQADRRARGRALPGDRLMGPQHAELELAPNMAGAEFLPQVSLLPEVDLIVTHGGNNTITEGLHFGKPMVVLPLFWDQYDNAQRIDETGFGRRLDTYGHEGPELTGAIDELLADRALAERLASVSAHLRGVRGTERAAELIATLG